MIKKFIVRKGTRIEDILFFNKIELEPVTLLLGGNGVGKSSLIQAILNQELDFESDDPNNATMIASYINSKQNLREMQRNTNLTYSDMFDPYIITRKMKADDLSEGQSIVYSMQDIFKLCKEIKEDKTDDKDYLFVLDEVDSGLSIDNVSYLAKKIKKINKDYPKINFIISFNNYEFCKVFKNAFNMYNGEWVKINSYDEYCKIINDNRKMLLKKRKNNLFTGNSNFYKDEYKKDSEEERSGLWRKRRRA